MKTFINAKLVLVDSIILHGYLKEDHGKIVSFGDMDDCVIEGTAIDCEEKYLAPGFIDIHSHGGGGFDYMDGTVQDIVGAARAHLHYGTTSVLPTTMTSSDEDLFHTISSFKEASKVTTDMPNLLGLHLEGPYFSRLELGAQSNNHILNPSPEHYMKVMEYADGCIKRWSFAPELPGALEMADRLAPMGVALAAGHTAATYDQMKEAFDHGVHHLTHFYSGMSTIVRKNGFRVLGVVESGYLIDGLTVELIADGLHLPPSLLRMILKFKSHDEICLCTDSMRGAGMPEGPSVLGSYKGGQAVIVEDGIAKMPDRTCFAGSVATTDRLVRVMVYEAGLSIWEAVKMISINAAKIIGCDNSKGSIHVGKDADLVVFDDSISISSVYVNGIKCAFHETQSNI